MQTSCEAAHASSLVIIDPACHHPVAFDAGRSTCIGFSMSRTYLVAEESAEARMLAVMPSSCITPSTIRQERGSPSSDAPSANPFQ